MALPPRLINARVTVFRVDRSGPGGDVTSAPEPILEGAPAIREVSRARPAFDAGTRREDTLEATFFMQPTDGTKVQRGDLINWEVILGGKVVDSGTGAEVRQIIGLVGSQTSIGHFELVAEV